MSGPKIVRDFARDTAGFFDRPEHLRALIEMRDERPRPVTSFFASLTPEQQLAARAYDGPDEIGDPAYLLAREKDYRI